MQQTTLDLGVSSGKHREYRVARFSCRLVREHDNDPDYLKRITVSKRDDVNTFIKQYLADLALEQFVCVALDGGNRIIGFYSYEGASNQCTVYPQNVFRFLLGCGANAFIMAHNHPGGHTSASAADWEITNRLFRIGRAMDLPLLDHVLICDDKLISLRDSNKWGE